MMRTHERIRVMILVLMITLLISASFLAIINFIILKKPKENINVDAFVIQPNSNLTEEQYNAYTSFEIGSDEAFNVIFPRDGCYYLAQQNYGEYFKGKTIYLTADMTITGRIHNFAGTLDGKGHSITMNDPVLRSFLSSGELYSYYGEAGLFCSQLNEGGTIKNIRFVNCKAKCNAANNFDMTYAGIIVGHNGGTVENCIVENCTFISDRQQPYCRVAPLVGKNEGTNKKGVVKNCIVRGTYTIGGNDDNGIILDSDGLSAHYFVATGFEAQYSIFGATMATTGVTDKLEYPSSHDTALTSNNGNEGSFTSAYNKFPSTIASSSVTSDTAWFKYSNNGEPRGYGGSASYPIYLRAFVKFETIKFTVASIDGEVPGKVNLSSMTFPSEYTKAAISENKISMYGYTIVATAYSDYKFVKWTNSSKTYTANFVHRGFKLTFSDDDLSVYDNSDLGKLIYKRQGTTYHTTVTESVAFRIANDADKNKVALEFLSSYDGVTTSKNGCYAAIKITFLGKLITNGEEESYERNYEVIFVLTSLEHYINLARVRKGAYYEYTSDQTITIDESAYIFVRYLTKDYGIGII